MTRALALLFVLGCVGALVNSQLGPAAGLALVAWLLQLAGVEARHG